MKYKAEGVPLVVLAGAEYGTGSSRDWAAKGPYLLGVRAVIAASFERIHRSNLVGMGVLPLQLPAGPDVGIAGPDAAKRSSTSPASTTACSRGGELTVRATAADGTVERVPAKVRIDTPVELEYYRNGGILQTVLRKLLASRYRSSATSCRHFQVVLVEADGLAGAEIEDRPAVGLPVIAVEAEHGGGGLKIADRRRPKAGGGFEIVHGDGHGHKGRQFLGGAVANIGHVVGESCSRPSGASGWRCSREPVG